MNKTILKTKGKINNNKNLLLILIINKIKDRFKNNILRLTLNFSIRIEIKKIDSLVLLVNVPGMGY